VRGRAGAVAGPHVERGVGTRGRVEGVGEGLRVGAGVAAGASGGGMGVSGTCPGRGLRGSGGVWRASVLGRGGDWSGVAGRGGGDFLPRVAGRSAHAAARLLLGKLAAGRAVSHPASAVTAGRCPAATAVASAISYGVAA